MSGSDFEWHGSIPDPAVQSKALDLYRAFFDPLKRWPMVTPQGLDALSGTNGPAIQEHWPEEARTVPRVPFPFHGIAPYLRPAEEPSLRICGQLVFDRANGGKLVSLQGADEQARERGDRADRSDVLDVRVRQGGHIRLDDHDACTGLALFLNVLALRYVADLKVVDGLNYFKNVGEEMRRHGWTGQALDESKPSALLVREVLSSFANPDAAAPGWDLSRTDPSSTGRQHALDFVPRPVDRIRRFGRIDPGRPAMVEEFALSALHYAAKSTGIVIPEDVDLVGLVSKLLLALECVRELEGFCEIADFGVKDLEHVDVGMSVGDTTLSCSLSVARVIGRLAHTG